MGSCEILGRVMDRSLLEQRLLSKVQPIKAGKGELPEITHSTQLTPLPQLPHNHKKGVQCRSCRLLRKIEKERQRQVLAEKGIDTAKEATVGIGTALVFGTLEIGKEFVGGVFDVGAKIAGNTDPVAQGVAIGGGIVALGWFISAYPEIATFLRLNSLGFKGLENSISDKLGRNDQTGIYGIESLGANQSNQGTRWYNSPSLRDAALILLTSPNPVSIFGGVSGFYPIGEIGVLQDGTNVLGYIKVSRKFTAGGGYVTYLSSTPPSDNPDADSAVNQWKTTAAPGSYWILVGQLPSGNWLVVNASTAGPFTDAFISQQSQTVSNLSQQQVTV